MNEIISNGLRGQFPNDNFLQLRVEAFDSEYPDSIGVAEVTINIIRLGVSNTTASVTISENTG